MSIDTTFRVVLDANVLFPFTLRDTLLRAAHLGFFQVYWSEQILDEATRNLISTGRMDSERSAKLIAAMHRAFPEALVQGHETLIDSMLNDEKDRHVAAAAVKVGAQLIVTSNLKDFKNLPDSIEAISPDNFLLDLLDLDTDKMLLLLHDQASSLKKPPITIKDLVKALAKTVPNFSQRLSNIL